MTITRRLAFAAPATFLLSRMAGAHHGFTGRYDTGAPIILSGVVRRASFSPPHPTVTITVDASPPALDGVRLPGEFTGRPAFAQQQAGQLVEVEFPPVQTFYRLGDRLRTGDRVTILALRNCLPPHQIRSQWVRLADGSVVEREGRLSYMVDGCRS